MVQEFTVQDMTCNGCAATVRKAITRLDGVQSIEIDVPAHNVRVDAVEGISAAAIAQAITEAGYTPLVAAAPKKAANSSITLISTSGSGCGDSCCS